MLTHAPVWQVLSRNGMYTIIDDHSEDTTAETNPTQWVSYYKQLMKDIASDSPSMMRVIVDILNEPDHASLTWSTVSARLILHASHTGLLHTPAES